MPSLHATADRRSELLAIVREVRRRWRLKVALRGVLQWVAASALLLLAAAWLLEVFRFSPSAIVAGRVLLAIGVAGLGWWLIGQPQCKRVSDEQVALYLEEHEPGLEAALLSAVHAGQNAGAEPSVLTTRVVETALERCQAIESGRRIDRQPSRRYAGAAAAVVVAVVAVILLGPAFLRHAMSALFLISKPVEAAAPYRIEVTPGTATVPKGADQVFSAALHGFTADEVSLVVRRGGDAGPERTPMVRSEDGRYESLLFDLSGSLEYVVEASGVRSDLHTLTVVELPYTKRLDHELTFPAYTGLQPQTVEDATDVAALKGTTVQVTVTPTMAAAGGRIVLEGDRAVPLTANSNGTLTGEFAVESDGFYRIELATSQGHAVAASPEHTVDMLEDQAPTVSIAKPGRDTAATPVEEFFIQAKADDDYAVRELQLVYAVNGGPEKVVSLFRGAKPLAEVTAGHTLYLEELDVKPGDSVSYYARSADNDAVAGPKRATSDMYFLQVRPFGKEFKPAVSMGGGGGGGGAGGQMGGLSQQQRQIIAGTFNVQRDRAATSAEALKERLTVLNLSQSRLREQVEGLVERMNSRLVSPDPALKKIADLLPQAVAEMKLAEAKLQARSPDGALPPEQKALQFLQQAEEEFELQVGMNNNAGGGGGGGTSSMAEDLADLFKLELDRKANQYEVAERANEQSADRKVDELAEKLKELARRQEQELERQRRESAGQSARTGRDGQRALAEQAEEAARQLDRLSREQNRPDLSETARQLREAAESMRRAAADGSGSAGSQAAAAADRLRRAQRQLEGTQGERSNRDTDEALRRAEQLVNEQRAIADAVKDLPGPGEERTARAQTLSQRKFELESKVAQLEQHLDRSAGEIGKQNRDASRELRGAADDIRNESVKETIRWSRGRLSLPVPPEQLRKLEDEVSGDLSAIRDRIAKAAEAVDRGDRSARGTDTLDRARELSRGVDSLGQRMAERAAERQRQQQADARRGQGQAQRDQQARGGQQGQQGQEGQSGQQGQAQQGGQAGQPGQQSGQEGSQGSDQGGGSTDGNDGFGDTDGAWAGGGGWGDRRTGRFTDEEIRQFRNEARRFGAEAQELRRMLREQNVDARDLDEILRRLRMMEDARTYQDVQEIARLQTFVSEGLKRFEFGLRRKLGADSDRVLLSGSGDVPPEYRRQVEEYYRSLSRPR